MSESPPSPGLTDTRVVNVEVRSKHEYQVLMLLLTFGLKQFEDAHEQMDGGDEVMRAGRALVEQVDEKEPVWPP